MIFLLSDRRKIRLRLAYIHYYASCRHLFAQEPVKRWASASPNSVASTVLDATSTAAAALEIHTTEIGLFCIPGISSDIILIQAADILLSVVGEEDWAGSTGGTGWRRLTVRRWNDWYDS